jgi:hypothetical protein
MPLSAAKNAAHLQRGLTVYELDPDMLAAKEMDLLAAEVEELLQ